MPERLASPVDDGQEQLRTSTRKLLALVIFGHAGQHWRTLKRAPAYHE